MKCRRCRGHLATEATPMTYTRESSSVPGTTEPIAFVQPRPPAPACTCSLPGFALKVQSSHPAPGAVAFSMTLVADAGHSINSQCPSADRGLRSEEDCCLKTRAERCCTMGHCIPRTTPASNPFPGTRQTVVQAFPDRLRRVSKASSI